MARGASGPRPRHVPQRTCVACRQAKAKRELIRVVRTVGGDVQVDPTGKKSGRGAYLCHSAECWAAGLRRGVLVRALKLESLRAEDVEQLEQFAGGLRSQAPESTGGTAGAAVATT